MTRFMILGIDLVSQTNKLKKHRIIGLFKTTTNKIFDKINGKRRVHFEQISHRSRPSINRAKCCRLASRLSPLSMISKRNLKQVTFKLELSNLLSVILLSSLSKLRIFSPLSVLYDASTSACGEVFYTWLNVLFCGKAFGVVVVLLFCGM